MTPETSNVIAAVDRVAPKVEIYFDDSKQSYWYKAGNTWVRSVEQHALQHVHESGAALHHKVKNEPFTEAQKYLRRIRETKRVIYAGPVAGCEQGIHGTGDNLYLCAGRPTMPEIVEGDWSDIKTLAERLFRGEDLNRIWGWHKQAVEGLWGGKKNFTQVFIMAGPGGCGKSFWQHNIITPMLGGRVAKPIQYMTGQTPFNGDLIGCEHFLLEDENAKHDYLSRRELGTAFKNYTANKQQRVHAKGKDGAVVHSRHWLSMSVNDETENLSVLPPMDDSLKDKVLLVHCQPAINNDWPGPNGRVQEMEERVNAQIGAWVWWLLNKFEVPEAIADYRFGVTGYQNEELVSRIELGSPEESFEALVNTTLEQAFKDKKAVTISADALHDLMVNDPSSGKRAAKLLHWSAASGTYLAKLGKRNPEKWRCVDKNARPVLWEIDFRK